VSAISGRMRRFLQKPGTADLSKYRRLLPAIAAREDELREVPDADLAGLAKDAKDLAGFCAVGREAARRALGERAFDVQLLGTLVMLSGQVAEMATGEGKTLSGALAAAGHAVAGRSVHVMSVNDYLAQRDAEWMRPVYDLLGVTVGWIGQASTPGERRQAYHAQVTYLPVTEAGFDVLRDRLVTDEADIIVPDPDAVLIDEADSVLIDEAMVPLVLAGSADPAETDTDMAAVARTLRPRLHYEVDDEGRNVALTDAGARSAERALGGIDLYDSANLDTLTRLNVALHAEALLHRDVDYIVRDGKVRLISPSRGREARLQRWPDGLQAAVEAKEGLTATESGEILDSITIEALVRRYPLVCGMTGTALPVGEELRQFYNLEVAVIPPNRPCVREDEPDRLYATAEQKESAIVAEVADAHEAGRPVLIGTLDIEESERLAGLLEAADLPCVVLNAKNDAAEAAIVAEAGCYGTITVSTQMAGRGTDIRLGGHDESDHERVADLGGLYVIGSGRHASVRVDDQLRGRAGRQGDPGGSVFFVSMEDELVTSYAPDAAAPGEVADDGLVTDAAARRDVAHAQRAAEASALDIHRNTWRYSKLVDDQRGVVLSHRARMLTTDAAIVALAGRCPERYDELSDTIDEDVLVAAGRQIVLYHLDRGWADHLAALAEIREGIHLRALGHGPNPFIMSLDPLTEFHAEAVKLFTSLFDQVETASAETFKTAAITADGIDLDTADLKRPNATWTYLVQDNPFGTDFDRALRRLVRGNRR
jgi:preprotein translocase subunit SecA